MKSPEEIFDQVIGDPKELDEKSLEIFFTNTSIKEKLLSFFLLFRSERTDNSKESLDIEIAKCLEKFTYGDLLKASNPNLTLVNPEECAKGKATFSYNVLDGYKIIRQRTWVLDYSAINTTTANAWLSKYRSELNNKYGKQENPAQLIDNIVRKNLSAGDKDSIANAVKISNSSLSDTEMTELQKRNSLSKKSEEEAIEHLKILEEQAHQFAKAFLVQTEVLTPEVMLEQITGHFNKLSDSYKTGRKR